MQLRAFPQVTRALVAALELRYERGEMTEQELAAQTEEVVQQAREALGLDDTWRTDPTPAADHQPTGYSSVFWKA